VTVLRGAGGRSDSQPAELGHNLGMVTIFGKDTCPYTQRAREDYEGRGVKVEYINVKKNPAELERMLGYSKGRRDVPVIVEGDRVTIGFGGT
jgi:glutaredoxin 3